MCPSAGGRHPRALQLPEPPAGIFPQDWLAPGRVLFGFDEILQEPHPRSLLLLALLMDGAQAGRKPAQKHPSSLLSNIHHPAWKISQSRSPGRFLAPDYPSKFFGLIPCPHKGFYSWHHLLISCLVRWESLEGNLELFIINWEPLIKSFLIFPFPLPQACKILSHLLLEDLFFPGFATSQLVKL